MDIRLLIILLVTVISLIILYLLNFYIPVKQYGASSKCSNDDMQENTLSGRYQIEGQVVQANLQYKRKRLLNEQEGRFYGILSSIIPEDRMISCKIRMEDMINVTTMCKNKLKYRNQINCRQIDFVVYDPLSGNVDCAIELSSARNDDSGFKNAVFRKIGIPLLHFQTKTGKYTHCDVVDIAKKIENTVYRKQYSCNRTMFVE